VPTPRTEAPAESTSFRVLELGGRPTNTLQYLRSAWESPACCSLSLQLLEFPRRHALLERDHGVVHWWGDMTSPEGPLTGTTSLYSHIRRSCRDSTLRQGRAVCGCLQWLERRKCEQT
jgi:hypothetical protein